MSTMPITEQYYEISAVARMSGLSPHVLRVWERRYSVVEPRRSDNQRRQYSQTDVDRLVLLKRLVDNGHAIGSVANLTMDQLSDRIEKLSETSPTDGSVGSNSTNTVQRIGLIGTSIRQSVRELADGDGLLRIVGEFEDLDELQASVQAGSIEVIFYEKDTLFMEDLPIIQRSIETIGAVRAFVIYRFAEGQVLESTPNSGITALRAPIETAGIQMALGTLGEPVSSGDIREISFHVDESIPPRMFSPEDLMRFSKISPALQCECPRHLATILRSLVAFEEYSSKCESKNTKDAELHGFLHLTTAQCRFDMEKALAKVLTHEGIRY
ncbi:MAG: hypothetical protein CMO61_04015 [Verrucomicrobiales bacterium]|mgnify:CR=1 FL=1|nr:hypothetical protein [Verrucomicrobiales bacterium]|tara:strand:+ start:3732 stop:4709 length:978 start_codon:yes stop_codon:yes gene_type:complete